MNVKWLANFIISLILSSLMGFSLVYTFTTSLRFQFGPLLVFLLVLAFMAAYSLIFSKPAHAIITGATLFLALAGGFAYAYKMDLLEKFAGRVREFANWFVQYVSVPTAYSASFAFYTLLLLCALISLPVYIFAFRKLSFYVVFIGGTAVFSVQWMHNYFVSYNAFYIFLLLSMVYYLKHVHLKNKISNPGEYGHQAAFSLWAGCVCLIALTASLLMPFNANPLQWEWLDSRLNTSYNFLSRVYNNYLSSNTSFTLAKTGFGGKALGGKVRLDDTPVLSVDSSKPLYLKGSARDYYTGYSWITSQEARPSSDEPADSIPLYSLSQNGSRAQLSDVNRSLRRLYGSERITVTYENLKTKSLFTPLDMYRINFFSNEQINASVDPNGILFSDKLLGKNFRYTVEMLPQRGNNEAIKTQLQRSETGLLYSSLRTLNGTSGFRTNLNNNLAAYSLIIPNEDYTHYTFKSPEGTGSIPYISQIIGTFENLNQIYSRYLQLPDTLPGRVRDLAVSLAEGSTNNYDRVKAVEDYLSGNYPYTLTPKATPMDRDFVDYFLFDQKEGYCTYYASAMTVLVRALGIPARYVEGYVTPPSPKSGSTYEVTNNQAHAWVEVYFEGFGWYTFEPTAPFVSSYYNRSTPTGAISSSFAQDSSYSGYVDWLMNGYNTPVEEPEAVAPVEPQDSGEQAPKSSGPLPGLILPPAVLGILLLLLAFNHWRHRNRLSGFYKMAPRESVLMLYRYYIQVLKLFGIPVRPHETPLQYSARVDGFFAFDGTNTFNDVTATFMAARYSQNDIPVDAKESAYAFHRLLFEKAKKKAGAVKFLLLKNLLGRF